MLQKLYDNAFNIFALFLVVGGLVLCLIKVPNRVVFDKDGKYIRPSGEGTVTIHNDGRSCEYHSKPVNR